MTRHSAMAAVASVLMLTGCERAPAIETTLTFDGQHRTISTSDVECTNQLDGSLVILVDDGPRHTVRVHLSRTGQLVVHRVGLRYEELAGFVADPNEVEATKGDDDYTFRGRMPPGKGETEWHRFVVSTTCPGYANSPPPQQGPSYGAP